MLVSNHSECTMAIPRIARFSRQCPICSQTIEVGDTIRYSGALGHHFWSHFNCHKPSTSATIHTYSLVRPPAPTPQESPSKWTKKPLKAWKFMIYSNSKHTCFICEQPFLKGQEADMVVNDIKRTKDYVHASCACSIPLNTRSAS